MYTPTLRIGHIMREWGMEAMNNSHNTHNN